MVWQRNVEIRRRAGSTPKITGGATPATVNGTLLIRMDCQGGWLDRRIAFDCTRSSGRRPPSSHSIVIRNNQAGRQRAARRVR